MQPFNTCADCNYQMFYHGAKVVRGGQSYEICEKCLVKEFTSEDLADRLLFNHRSTTKKNVNGRTRALLDSYNRYKIRKRKPKSKYKQRDITTAAGEPFTYKEYGNKVYIDEEPPIDVLETKNNRNVGQQCMARKLAKKKTQEKVPISEKVTSGRCEVTLGECERCLKKTVGPRGQRNCGSSSFHHRRMMEPKNLCSLNHHKELATPGVIPEGASGRKSIEEEVGRWKSNGLCSMANKKKSKTRRTRQRKKLIKLSNGNVVRIAMAGQEDLSTKIKLEDSPGIGPSHQIGTAITSDSALARKDFSDADEEDIPLTKEALKDLMDLERVDRDLQVQQLLYLLSKKHTKGFQELNQQLKIVTEKIQDFALSKDTEILWSTLGEIKELLIKDVYLTYGFFYHLYDRLHTLEKQANIASPDIDDFIKKQKEEYQAGGHVFDIVHVMESFNLPDSTISNLKKDFKLKEKDHELEKKKTISSTSSESNNSDHLIPKWTIDRPKPPVVSSPIRTPRESELDPFDGIRANWQPFKVRFQVWLRKYSTFYSTDVAKSILLLEKMNGASKTWATTYLTNIGEPKQAPEISHFSDLLALAEQTWGESGIVKKAEAAITKIWAGNKPLSDYIAEFNRLRFIVEWGDRELSYHFR